MASQDLNGFMTFWVKKLRLFAKQSFEDILSLQNQIQQCCHQSLAFMKYNFEQFADVNMNVWLLHLWKTFQSWYQITKLSQSFLTIFLQIYYKRHPLVDLWGACIHGCLLSIWSQTNNPSLCCVLCLVIVNCHADSMVHGAYMGPTWGTTGPWAPSQYKDRLIYVWRFPC